MKALIIIMLFVSVAFAGDLKSIDDTWEIVDIPDGCLKWDEDLQEWECATRADYERGFLMALDCMMLLDLELKLEQERKTWGERNNICKERHNIKKGAE